MKFIAKLSLIVGVLLVLSGCSQPSTVAVVNIDTVIENSPLKSFIRQSLAERYQKMKEHIDSQGENYQQQIAQFEKQMGEKPSTAQAAKLAKVKEDARQRLNELKAKANKDMKEYEKQLTLKAMENIRQAAKRVAEENGFDIVLSDNEKLVLSYGRNVDMTGPVTHYVSRAFKVD